jgi:orotidine-5'-phosphate decarboxylase
MDIIISLDTFHLGKIQTVVEETCSISHIRGYKIGAQAALYNGLFTVKHTILETSSLTYGSLYDEDLEIIYDHQKLGNDIGAMAELMLYTIRVCGIENIIVFPFTGTEAGLHWVREGLKDTKISLIVGGYLTDPQVQLHDTDNIFRFLDMSRHLGVKKFVLPATELTWSWNVMTYFDHFSNPEDPFLYYMPGIGVQGADIEQLRSMGSKYNVIPIIGRSIVDAEDIQGAAWNIIRSLNMEE